MKLVISTLFGKLNTLFIIVVVIYTQCMKIRSNSRNCPNQKQKKVNSLCIQCCYQLTFRYYLYI